MPGGTEIAATAGEDQREVFPLVRIAVPETGAEEDHAVIQHTAFAFLHRFQAVEQIGILLHVPEVDAGVLLQLFLLVGVVGTFVVTFVDAFEEAEVRQRPQFREDGLGLHGVRNAPPGTSALPPRRLGYETSGR